MTTRPRLPTLHPMNATTHHRICPLCEACCGLEIKVQDQKVISIRGHEADVLSRGYICPKAIALKDLHEDPDRLRTPLIRVGERGKEQWKSVTWGEALDVVSVFEAVGACAAGTPSGTSAATVFSAGTVSRWFSMNSRATSGSARPRRTRTCASAELTPSSRSRRTHCATGATASALVS